MYHSDEDSIIRQCTLPRNVASSGAQGKAQRTRTLKQLQPLQGKEDQCLRLCLGRLFPEASREDAIVSSQSKFVPY